MITTGQDCKPFSTLVRSSNYLSTFPILVRRSFSEGGSTLPPSSPRASLPPLPADTPSGRTRQPRRHPPDTAPHPPAPPPPPAATPPPPPPATPPATRYPEQGGGEANYLVFSVKRLESNNVLNGYTWNLGELPAFKTGHQAGWPQVFRLADLMKAAHPIHSECAGPRPGAGGRTQVPPERDGRLGF